MALNTLPVYAGKADMIGRYEYIHSKLELYVRVYRVLRVYEIHTRRLGIILHAG